MDKKIPVFKDNESVSDMFNPEKIKRYTEIDKSFKGDFGILYNRYRKKEKYYPDSAVFLFEKAFDFKGEYGIAAVKTKSTVQYGEYTVNGKKAELIIDSKPYTDYYEIVGIMTSVLLHNEITEK